MNTKSADRHDYQNSQSYQPEQNPQGANAPQVGRTARKRVATTFCKSKGVALGCEFSEALRNKGRITGRVSFRAFIEDKSKEQIRFIAEPREAYAIYAMINQIARSKVSCKLQTSTHPFTRVEDGKTIEMATTVSVEKWVKPAASGYAVIISRTIDRKTNTYNISIKDMKDCLYYGEFLRFLSCSQAWEIAPNGAKKQSMTIFGEGDLPAICEISEFDVRNGKSAGSVMLRFFAQNKSMRPVRFMADPKDAYRLYLSINKVARSQTDSQEQILLRAIVLNGDAATEPMPVAVERWTGEGKVGYAITGANTVGARTDLFNVLVQDVNDFRYYGELLRVMSCSQAWETNSQGVKERIVNFFGTSAGRTVGCEIAAHHRVVSKGEGRVSIKGFAKGTGNFVRYVAEPREAFGLYLMINTIARSQVSCKMQSPAHTISRTEKEKEVVTSSFVEVEKVVEESGTSYAVTITRSINDKINSFNIPIAELSDFLYLGEFLRFMSYCQSWSLNHLGAKKRQVTVFSRANDVALGCEIGEFDKPGEKGAGKVSMRFFIQDKSKEQVRFVAEPREAYGLYLAINKAARSLVACKEQAPPHASINTDTGKDLKVMTGVTVEKWIKNGKTGYAIIGSRSMNGKGNCFNIAIQNVNDFLYYGEMLRALSCAQAWESFVPLNLQ